MNTPSFVRIAVLSLLFTTELCAGVRIGISLPSHAGEWFTFNKALVNAIRAQDIDCVSLSCRNDAALQAEQCDFLLRQKVQCLILAAAEPHQAANIVKRAHLVSAPVLSVERLLPNCEVDFYVGFDYRHAGMTQATQLLKLTGGRYALIGGPAADIRQRLLRSGQLEALKPYLASNTAEIFSHHWLDDANAPVSAVDSLFDGNGRIRVQAVLSGNASVPHALAQRLNATTTSEPVLIAGFGMDLETEKRIRNGTQLLSILAEPANLVEATVRAATALARREPIHTQQTVNNGQMEIPADLVRPVVVNSVNLRRIVSQP